MIPSTCGSKCMLVMYKTYCVIIGKSLWVLWSDFNCTSYLTVLLSMDKCQIKTVKYQCCKTHTPVHWYMYCYTTDILNIRVSCVHQWYNRPWWVTTSHSSSTTSPDLTPSGVSSSPPNNRRVMVLNISLLSSSLSLFSRSSGIFSWWENKINSCGHVHKASFSA